MHVAYQRHGGLAPRLMNRGMSLDQDLTPEDARHVRALLPPEFFSLESSRDSGRNPDMFRHEIAVTVGDRSHRVILAEDEVPASLRPLVDWLQAKASAAAQKAPG
jgi:hypothetical protein